MKAEIERIDVLLKTTPKDADLLALKHRIFNTGQVTQSQLDMLEAIDTLRAVKPAALAKPEPTPAPATDAKEAK